MKYLVNILKKLKLKLKLKQRKEIPLNDSEFVKNVCKFTVNECVVGDYYEFGVFRGQTLVSFYLKLMRVATKRISNTGNEGREALTGDLRKRIKNETIFNAFDSFEGLPNLSHEDEKSSDFAEGQYSAGTKVVERLAINYGMPTSRLRFHKGWFSETCTKEYFENNALRPASIIWLDCDLYSSAKDAFKLIELILQDGTMIIIDDWYCFKGNPGRGVQKAWYEFSKSDSVAGKFIFSEYQTDGWARKSFIANTNEGV